MELLGNARGSVWRLLARSSRNCHGRNTTAPAGQAAVVEDISKGSILTHSSPIQFGILFWMGLVSVLRLPHDSQFDYPSCLVG
jgi:hypothetical protein